MARVPSWRFGARRTVFSVRVKPSRDEGVLLFWLSFAGRLSRSSIRNNALISSPSRSAMR
jgi:hypothetical protein